MTNDITTIASDYLETRENTVSEDHDLDRLREKRDEWLAKMEGLDEEDPLYEIAEENADEYSEKIERIEESENSLKEQETELVRTTANKFIPRGDWTNEEVIRALNRSLLDENREYILIGTTRVEPETTVADDEDVFDIATAVRTVAKQELGESTALREFWEEFQDLKRFKYYEEIAESDDPLTGKDIAERIGAEDQRQAISQALIETTDGDVNPYFKQGRGEYTLSFVGRYLLREYGGERYSDDDESSEEDDSEDDATLDEFDQTD